MTGLRRFFRLAISDGRQSGLQYRVPLVDSNAVWQVSQFRTRHGRSAGRAQSAISHASRTSRSNDAVPLRAPWARS